MSVLKRIFFIFMAQAFASVSADVSHIVRSQDFNKITISCEKTLPPILDIKFSPKAHLFVSASENLVCIWSAQTLERKARFFNTAFSKINALEIDADAKSAYLATGISGESGRLIKLDLKSGQFEILAEASDEFFCLSLEEDRLAAGAMGGEFVVLNLNDGKKILEGKVEGKKIAAIDFSLQAKFLAYISSDGQIFVRSADDEYQSVAQIIDSGAPPISMSFLPRSQKDLLVASGFGENSKVKIIPNFTMRSVREFPLPNSNISALFYRPSANPILLASKSGFLRAIKQNPANMEPLDFEAVNCRLESVCAGLSQNLVAGGENGEIFIWNTNNNATLLGGIKLLDYEGKDYAVWTSEGYAHSTKDGALQLLKSDNKKFEFEVDYISKLDVDEFLRSKNLQNAPKKAKLSPAERAAQREARLQARAKQKAASAKGNSE